MDIVLERAKVTSTPIEYQLWIENGMKVKQADTYILTEPRRQNTNIAHDEGMNFKTAFSFYKDKQFLEYLNPIHHIPANEYVTIHQLIPDVPYIMKVRVTWKGPVRTCKGKKGEFQVFSVDLVDKEGDEITANFFEAAFSTFKDLIQEGRVYVVRGGKVKKSNKNQDTINDYVIVYDKGDDKGGDASLFTEVEDDPTIKYNNKKFQFYKIADLEDVATDSKVDMAGFVRKIKWKKKIGWKKISIIDFLQLLIVDDSNTLIKVNLWGDLDKYMSICKDQVIILKSAKVVQSNHTKQLLMDFTTRVITNPEQIPQNHPAIQRLTEWRLRDFKSELQLNNISKLKRNFYTIEEIINFSKTMDNQTYSFKLKATVSLINSTDKLFYAVCPNERYRKLPPVQACQREADRYCEKCLRYFDKHGYKLKLTIKISDFTGGLWVLAIDKDAENLIESDGMEIKMLIDNKEKIFVEEKLKQACGREVKFRLIVRRDPNDANKIIYQTHKVKIINYQEFGLDFVKILKEYENIL